jgi:protein SCO1/2
MTTWRALATLATLLALAPLDLRAASIPQLERVRVVEPPREVGDFELIDRKGEAFRFSSLRGRPVLVAFGFASCPDVCPTVMSRLLLLSKLHAAELRDTAIVLISVDGERDSPQRLDDFLSIFSAEFIGLTGMPDVVRPVADRFPAVFFKESPDAAGNYNVAHSAQVYLLDRRGRVRAELLNAPIETMAEVVGIVAAESP